MKKQLLIPSLIVALLLLFFGIYLLETGLVNIPQGEILLRTRSQEISAKSAIIVVSGDGNNIRWVGNYEGSPTWSPDGRYIAVGCKSEICVLDYATLPDRRNKLGNQNRLPESAYRLQAPQFCSSSFSYGDGSPYSGILSMSWSPDGKSLAVVCGGEKEEGLRSVCILPLEGDMKCWEEGISKDVYRVAWSPADKDLIAIGGSGSGGTSSKIYLVDQNGENPVYLTYGWSPEWSPDGEQIAFISDEPGSLGIATIHKDGTNRQWLYVSTSQPRDERIYFDCRGISGTCRLSWSADQRHITFVSSNGDIYSYKLYRLDIKTGKVIELIDEMLFEHVAEPDWGP